MGSSRQAMQHSHISYPPAEGKREVSEGWLVVASQAAWEVMKSQLGTLKCMVYVERSFYHEGERLQHDIHAERLIDR